MSAQEFKHGDRVRTHNGVGTVAAPAADIVRYDDGGWDSLSNPRIIASICRLDETAEPEWVIGQQVSGDDYARLPVGSKAVWKHCADSDGLPAEKIAVGSWREGSAPNSPIRTDAEMSLPRTLTHLGDGMADWERELLAEVDAEDKDDLYVEPEPLKRGDAVLVWARVVDAKPDSDGDLEVVLDRAPGGLVDDREAYVRADAIVRPDAGQVPPWIKAVEEPTGLGAVVVVNTNGWKWVRSRPGYADPWQQVGGDGQRRWSDFPADVEVLSEGWTGGAS